MILLNQMIAFFIFLIIGYRIRKKEIIDEKGSAGISWIISNAANPALIVSGAVNAQEYISISRIVFILISGVIVYIILVAISFIIPELLRVQRKDRRAYRNLIIFSNVGFMGYPLLSAVMGPQAVLCASIYTLPFSVLLYTFCIENMKEKKAGEEKTGFSFRKLLNIGIAACVLALCINIVNPPVPEFAKITVTGLANLTAALSMINIGAFLTKVNFKELLEDRQLIIYTVIKMLVIPVVGTLLMKCFVKDEMIVMITMIILATPVASMVAILASQNKEDNVLETSAVALTTSVSIVTIPLVSLIVNLL